MSVTMTNKDLIVLLSGGLDSYVSVALLKREFNIVKALHFDYGQTCSRNELLACQRICGFFDIDLEVVSLDWYSKISQSSALNKNNKDRENKSYWMPNRNGLFVNIAASYADALCCKYIAIGANLEEAKVYSDNSFEFVKNVNNTFKMSTKYGVELLAPLLNMDKNSIIRKAIELDIPLEFVWSCYKEQDNKHCGLCPSCVLLKKALLDNNKNDIVEKIF